jgi:hypothetical protein
MDPNDGNLQTHVAFGITQGLSLGVQTIRACSCLCATMCLLTGRSGLRNLQPDFERARGWYTAIEMTYGTHVDGRRLYPGRVLCRVKESCAPWRELLNSLGGATG